MGAKQSQLPIAVFNDSPSKKLPRQFSPNTSGTVVINNEQMNSLVEKKTCQDLKIFNIQYKLQFTNINQPQRIWNEISHIKFPFLMILNLMGNNLETVQPLGQMWLPGLEELNLRGNNSIVSVQQIRKLKMKLKQLQLQKNKINDLQKLGEIGTRKYRYLKLSIDQKDRYGGGYYGGGGGATQIVHNPTWILKTKLLLKDNYDVKYYFPIQKKAELFSDLYRKAGKK